MMSMSKSVQTTNTLYSYAAFRCSRAIKGDESRGSYGEEVDVYQYGAIILTLATGQAFDNTQEDLNEKLEEMGAKAFIERIKRDDNKILEDIKGKYSVDQVKKIIFVLYVGRVLDLE